MPLTLIYHWLSNCIILFNYYFSYLSAALAAFGATYPEGPGCASSSVEMLTGSSGSSPWSLLDPSCQHHFLKIKICKFLI